ncbi:MAG: LysE family transporter [Lautropia sp.]|nr:LysE family transporter [Lautropia sp.]
MSHTLLPEFLTLASVHFVAMAAPGPDFTLVMSQSVRHGRSAGIWVSLGIAAGLSIHVIYTVLGVGALMHTTPWLLNVARTSGAAYIGYVAWRMLRAQAAGATSGPAAEKKASSAQTSARELFAMGFLTNATNPKVTLFFLAIFTSVVDAQTPPWAQAGYGAWMCMVNAIWFSLVATFFATRRVRDLFLRLGHWFERIMGLLLMLFALRLLWEMTG